LRCELQPALRTNERENARQRSLDELELDEFAETACDDLVRVGADVCQTPVALILIIDGERQWFKSQARH
jgi:hypothetical protein